MRSYLDDVKNKYQSEVIVALVEDIEAHDDEEDLFTLCTMSKLSLWLYVLGDYRNSLYFAGIVSELDLGWYHKIKGFYDSAATAIASKQKALALCTVLCNEMGDSEKSKSFWSQYLTTRFEMDKFGKPSDGMVARKRWKRNLEKGDLVDLYTSGYQAYIATGRESRGMSEMCGLLEELLWMREAGGSELYPVDKLTQLIDEQVTYLRNNIEKAKKKDFCVKRR
ncbi:MAG: hypothetical protein LUE98_08020 [Tannerellaceae bacterium]|nr:hypothetical protein [Tannerellaceae bacterium]